MYAGKCIKFDPTTFTSSKVLRFPSLFSSYVSRTSLTYQVPVIPLVHGTSLAGAHKIAQSGFSTISSLDAGFYGAGTRNILLARVPRFPLS